MIEKNHNYLINRDYMILLNILKKSATKTKHCDVYFVLISVVIMSKQ